jgi:methylenetetrahydrofolate reductase (NADPH)
LPSQQPSSNGSYAGSNLEKVLQSGQFVVTGELGPPQGWKREDIERKVKLLKGVVDAVNLTDNQTAIVRLSSIASAKIVLEENVSPVRNGNLVPAEAPEPDPVR